MSWLISRITNNPMVVIYVAGLCFAAGLASGAIPAWKVQGWRLDAVQARYDSFVAQTKLMGEQAAKDKLRIETEHQLNLEVARNEYNDKLPQVRSDAVRNYLATHPRMPVNKDTSSGTLPSPPDGAQGTDGTGQEQGTTLCSPDTVFIQNAADDALKIGAWQKWAILNKLPIN